MPLLNTQLQVPVYEFETTGGTEFGTVTLRAADIPGPGQEAALVEIIKTFLEDLPGVNGVLARKYDLTPTVT
jgi:hypothetical protein